MQFRLERAGDGHLCHVREQSQGIEQIALADVVTPTITVKGDIRAVESCKLL